MKRIIAYIRMWWWQSKSYSAISKTKRIIKKSEKNGYKVCLGRGPQSIVMITFDSRGNRVTKRL